MLDKKALRKRIGQQKRALSPEQIQAYSRNLAEKLYRTPEYRAARSVYGYLPYNQEVRTWQILERARADGKRVAVPKVYGDTMKFLWLDDFSQVAEGAYTIPEPVFDEPEADDETALVLMPGLAFDPQGHRVGYGGGFYDKYLEAHTRHRLVALCYPFQMFDFLDVEAHDIPVDRVICADAVAEDYELVPPTPAHAAQVAAYRNAFLEAGDSMDGTASLAKAESPLEWIEMVRRCANPDTVPENLVQATQFLCLRKADGELVGMIQLRHRFNDYLEKFGGNIGYSVRPDARRKGCARWMLGAILPFCRKSGLKKLLVTCLQKNEASRRTILANGGVYESTVRDEAADETLERYWIEL